MLVTIHEVKPGDFFTVPQDGDGVRYELIEYKCVRQYPGKIAEGPDATLSPDDFVGLKLQLIIPLV